MNLLQLINDLQALINDGDCDGSELVMFAHQPHYPLQCSIDGPNVVENDEVAELESYLQFPLGQYFETQEEHDAGRKRLEELRKMKTVYLCEGGWRPRREDGTELSPYAPRAAWGEY